MKSIVRVFVSVIVFSLIFGGIAIAQSTSKTDANIELARKSEEEFWSKGNLEVADEIFSNEFIRHSAEMPDMKGREAYKQFMLGFREAFPDWKSTIENIFASGDLVAVKLTATGTMTGTLRGGPSGPPLPPTGKRLEFPVVDIYRISEGKIVELWCYYYDVARILVALGVLPPPPTPVASVKPSFITLTPGQYVNGWPAFTVSYPKEWEVQPYKPGQEPFRAAALRPPLPPSPTLAITTFMNPADISGSANILAGIFSQVGKDIKILYNNPSKLQDGTPAQEAEIEFILKVVPNEPKINTFHLATKKDGIWIWLNLYHDQKIGEDLKSIAYSMKFLQGREEPVKVPSDVQEFLDKWCADILSHDADRFMTNYSDQLLHNGMQKAFLDQWVRNNPMSHIQRGTISCEPTVTVFEAQGDKAYIDGFMAEKSRGDPNVIKMPMSFQQIIKEGGQWKWYGNQK